MSERTILLVEDNPADITVVREALAQLDRGLRLEVAGDGQAAINYLSGKPPFNRRDAFPVPDLILLDLTLPRLDGFHVLEWVRTEPFLRRLPVVVLATSSYSADIHRAYAFGANSFITKPQSLDKLVRDLQTALDYWLDGLGRAAPESEFRDAA